MTEQPKVIIRCLVYNHEPYLRDCLEGFVMQKTNFPFKAVVHDDCSTDGSAAIIREYAEKYPHIIEPIYETENQYSKRDGSLGRIMNEATLGRSPYIAYCEGDDYWIDPFKLQKQVDFLDTHKDYSMCFSACEIVKEREDLNVSFFGDTVESREYTATELLKTWMVPTASICIRESVANDKRLLCFDRRKTCGDIFIILTAAHHGRVYAMDEKMVVYRVNPGSIMQKIVLTQQKRTMKRLLGHFTYIEENYPLVDRRLIRQLKFISQTSIVFSCNFSLVEKLKALLRSICIWPRKFIILYNIIVQQKKPKGNTSWLFFCIFLHKSVVIKQ